MGWKGFFKKVGKIGLKAAPVPGKDLLLDNFFEENKQDKNAMLKIMRATEDVLSRTLKELIVIKGMQAKTMDDVAYIKKQIQKASVKKRSRE